MKMIPALTHSTGSKPLPPLSKGPRPEGKEPGPARGHWRAFSHKASKLTNDKDMSMDTDMAGTAPGGCRSLGEASAPGLPNAVTPFFYPPCSRRPEEAECMF